MKIKHYCKEDTVSWISKYIRNDFFNFWLIAIRNLIIRFKICLVRISLYVIKESYILLYQFGIGVEKAAKIFKLRR